MPNPSKLKTEIVVGGDKLDTDKKPCKCIRDPDILCGRCKMKEHTDVSLKIMKGDGVCIIRVTGEINREARCGPAEVAHISRFSWWGLRWECDEETTSDGNTCFINCRRTRYRSGRPCCYPCDEGVVIVGKQFTINKVLPGCDIDCSLSTIEDYLTDILKELPDPECPCDDTSFSGEIIRGAAITDNIYMSTDAENLFWLLADQIEERDVAPSGPCLCYFPRTPGDAFAEASKRCRRPDEAGAQEGYRTKFVWTDADTSKCGGCRGERKCHTEYACYEYRFVHPLPDPLYIDFPPWGGQVPNFPMKKLWGGTFTGKCCSDSSPGTPGIQGCPGVRHGRDIPLFLRGRKIRPGRRKPRL